MNSQATYKQRNYLYFLTKRSYIGVALSFAEASRLINEAKNESITTEENVKSTSNEYQNQIEVTHLLKLLEKVKLPIKSTCMPVLENLLFMNNKIISTDLEVFNEIKTDLAIGNGCVDTKKFYNLIKSLKSFDFITLDFDNDHLLVTSPKGTYKLGKVDYEDYPDLTGADKVEYLHSVNSEWINELVKITTPFLDDDKERRLAMTGLCFEYRAKGLDVTATNGHTLKSLHFPKRARTKDLSFVICQEMLKRIKFLDGEIKVSIGISKDKQKNTFISHIIFDDGILKIRSRNINKMYPDWRSVVPSFESEGTTKITLDKKELLDTLQRVAMFVPSHSRKFTFRFCEDAFMMANDDDTGNNFKESLDFLKKGEDMEIAFNHSNFTDFVKSITHDRIIMQLYSPNKPIVMSKDNEITLVMPLRNK